ncbi:MAG TPA: sugar phosphate isomerase/epimerase family protein [Chthoniobacterales bacterium]|jgi:sugar phosphate isomerase/epimerase|nr:sugar phosphate isomerase/epimerase family protein [Chthoniobacterales bacterium]
MKLGDRLSINHYSVRQLTLEQLVEECRQLRISYVGLWREKVRELGIERAKALIDQAELRISSLCRAGFFPYDDAAQRQKSIEENRKAIDEAAVLGAQLVVLVCGGIAAAGLSASREMVAEGIANLVPYAVERGVRLGIEPLHPMFAADRSVIVTLAQANELAAHFPAEVVGIVIDAYHVWWDPALESEIGRAAGRIFGFHVSDWIVPLPDVLNGRGLMGDGYIDLSGISSIIEQAGYDGPIEVEIFNQALWQLAGRTALSRIRERFRKFFPDDH